MDELFFVGKDIPRVDARAKVTGEALFTVDITFPNMLWGQMLRSPHPHARILNIDTRRAERLPGVKAVITGKDTPFVFGVSHMDQIPLQTEKVRYVGDPVAGVAAVDLDTAQEALSLIRVDYEPLPAVFDPEEAMKPGAPVIHEGKERNLAANPVYNLGDVEEAFREADYVFEDRLETQRVAHVCPEPHNCVAVWEHSGKLTFYYCSQMPSVSRVQLSKALGIPESKIRVITNNVGGGFGSRATSKFPMDFVAIVLARKSGRPVKIEYTRADEFIYSTFRHKFIMTVKTGIKKDGTITGRHFTNICDNGAYSDYGPVVTNVGGAMQGTLYRFMNYRYDGYTVYTNLPYGGAMRGIGNPQVHYAGETQLNMIAHRLGMDPLELRIKNAVRKGDETATGAVLKSCGLVECLEAVAEKIDWKEKRARPETGAGSGNCLRGSFYWRPALSGDRCRFCRGHHDRQRRRIGQSGHLLRGHRQRLQHGPDPDCRRSAGNRDGKDQHHFWGYGNLPHGLGIKGQPQYGHRRHGGQKSGRRRPGPDLEGGQ